MTKDQIQRYVTTVLQNWITNKIYLNKIGEQDGVLTYDDKKINTSNTYYAECVTDADQTNKIITVSDFELVSGVTIIVKFTKGNSVKQPKLKINSEDAKSITYRDSDEIEDKLSAKGSYLFRYDGTGFALVGDVNQYETKIDVDAIIEAVWDNFTPTGYQYMETSDSEYIIDADDSIFLVLDSSE